MVYFGKFMSWPVGKCPNKERSDQFSSIGKQKKIAHLIAGHPVDKSTKKMQPILPCHKITILPVVVRKLNQLQ